MASTYSTNLGIELIGTGEQSGTWGTTTNTNLGTLLEQSIAGYATQAVTDGSPTVLTIANGASSTGRNAVISLTGALTAARVVEVPAKTKVFVFSNDTTGGFAVTVKVTGQTGVSIPNGTKAVVYCDATDVRNILSNITVNATSGNVGIGTTTPAVKLAISGTDAVLVPVGTTAQRPTAATGYFRYNTDNVAFEGYNGTAWGPVGGSGTVNSGTSGQVAYYASTGTALSGTSTLAQLNWTNTAVTVTTNAGTVPVTSKLNTFTNSSAATMTITMATASAVDGQMSIVRIYDSSAVAQTITWVNTEDSSSTAPTTSNGSTTLPRTVGFMYNSATSKWRCIANS